MTIIEGNEEKSTSIHDFYRYSSRHNWAIAECPHQEKNWCHLLHLKICFGFPTSSLPKSITSVACRCAEGTVSPGAFRQLCCCQVISQGTGRGGYHLGTDQNPCDIRLVLGHYSLGNLLPQTPCRDVIYLWKCKRWILAPKLLSPLSSQEASLYPFLG